MIAQLGRIRGTKQRSVYGKNLQPLPRIIAVALPAPLIARLAKQPFDRIRAEAFAGFGHATTGEQVVCG